MISPDLFNIWLILCSAFVQLDPPPLCTPPLQPTDLFFFLPSIRFLYFLLLPVPNNAAASSFFKQSTKCLKKKKRHKCPGTEQRSSGWVFSTLHGPGVGSSSEAELARQHGPLTERSALCVCAENDAAFLHRCVTSGRGRRATCKTLLPTYTMGLHS